MQRAAHVKHTNAARDLWSDTAGCRPQSFTTRLRVLLLGVFAAQSDVINASNVATLSEKSQQSDNPWGKWSNPRWRSRLIVMWIYWKIICWNDHYITGLTLKEQEHLWTTQPGYLSLKLQVWVRAALFGSYYVSGFWQNALLVITGWHKEECVKWCLQPSRRLAEGLLLSVLTDAKWWRVCRWRPRPWWD